MSGINPGWLEIEAPPIIGHLAERATQISGKSYVPKDAKPLLMLREDRENLIASGWRETATGWEKKA